MHRRLLHVLISRRLRRAIVLAGVLAVGLLTAFAAVSAALAREEPSWWTIVALDDPATVETARVVEDSLRSLLTRGRPTDATHSPEAGVRWRSEPWSFKVREAEANAWLNVRLPKWIANQTEDFVWPQEVSQIQVDFTAGEVRVGARVRVGGRDQILSATLTPAMNGDGSLSAPASWVHVGRLSIPASWVLDAAEPVEAPYVPQDIRSLPETESMFRAFRGEVPISEDPVIKIGNGRGVRILGVQPQNGALIVHCRTELQ